MGNTVSLVTLTNSDRGFYTTLGPYLANRDVVKAVGGPIWDDDTKTWLVVKDGRTVLGFVAVAARGGRITVESLYVQPGMNRVASELVGVAAERFGNGELHATVMRTLVSAYLAAGFEETGETGQFVRLVRSAA